MLKNLMLLSVTPLSHISWTVYEQNYFFLKTKMLIM